MINAVAVVQEFYRAMGAGDVEHIAALLSPDLEWTGAESFPYYSGLSLKQRSVPSVTPVEPDSIAGVKPMHRHREA